ncbi:transforming acidic coiled-coil containing protein [Fusarium heterosporum]|uniref:Transforming acidic coiled-coil containing protein n=1 Tax=Fusarium heterosporum TaxID=42747 RepID=A0A8H5TSZ3_FUSHE|nr:transforming acidic coiled-coil containing protein [Fusarium heterosporum]
MHGTVFILSGMAAIARASTSSGPPTSSAASPMASMDIPPIVVQAEAPIPVAEPIIPGFTRSKDVEGVIGKLNGLAYELFLQVDNFGGDGIKVQVIWEAYLHCRDVIDGVEQALNGMSSQPEIAFDYAEQKSICSSFDSFGIDQSKLVTVLVKDVDFIAMNGFANHFGQCLARLQPAMIRFIEQLTAYAPQCEFEMLRRRDQLEVAYDGAVRLMGDHHEGTERIPLPLD